MSKIIMIEARREAYSLEDLKEETLTAAELIEILSEMDPDAPIYLSHDGGYTYGALRQSTIEEMYEEEEEEE